jgi:hypothetical protein
VPQVNISIVSEHQEIMTGAVYFTKECIYIIPFQSFSILKGNADTKMNYSKSRLDDLKNQVKALDLSSFDIFMKTILEPDNIFVIKELEVFEIIVGFWIFGSVKIRKKGGRLHSIGVQPTRLREKIRKYYIAG